MPIPAPYIIPPKGGLLKLFNQLLRDGPRATVIRVNDVIGNFTVVLVSLQHQSPQYFLWITIL